MPKKKAVDASDFAISSGHQLATEAAFAILKAGGNAVDAGVAAGIALGVLHSDLVNVAGVAPIILRMADDAEVVSIDGLGTWPAAASVEYFEREHGGAIPQGLMRTVVPAAPAAWITVLARYGTMSFADVAAGAIRCAKEGFPVYPLLALSLANHEADYRRTPDHAALYLPGGRPPKEGEIFVQSDLAGSLQYMVDQERAAGGDRANGLRAAYDAFYRGDIAKKICDYHRAKGGFMRESDLDGYRVRFEAPLKVSYAGYDVYGCGAWCQGISLAQAFALLREVELDGLEHNSPAYIHRLTEAFKLVFADREEYVADPAFVDVPVAGMLDEDYLQARAALIDDARAWPEMPPPGDPLSGEARTAASMEHSTELMLGGDVHATKPQEHRASQSPLGGPPGSTDTSYVCVVDAAGNMFSATPSDPSSDSEVIPGTGLCPSSRGSQSRGISTSINKVEPGKRPRLTPNPALALKDGKPFMTWGTPGGDVQVQAMVQVFLNATRFGMDMQEAVSAPRFASYSFPSSFAPNDYFPGLLMMENRIDKSVAEDLNSRGHKVDWWPEMTWKAGGVCAIRVDGEAKQAGADPRRAAYAMGK
jgi:gamma-glutamyltranspeptidase/glutathione hydrolase